MQDLTFGEFKNLRWLYYDPNAVDVFLLIDMPFIVKWCTAYHIPLRVDENLNINESSDELIEKLKNLSKQEHFGWNIVYCSGRYFIKGAFTDDMFQDMNDAYVKEFDITSLKRPTVFINLEN